jgi:hypothetical protein
VITAAAAAFYLLAANIRHSAAVLIVTAAGCLISLLIAQLFAISVDRPAIDLSRRIFRRLRTIPLPAAFSRRPG